MIIEQAVYSILSGNTDLTDVLPATSMFAGNAPQDTPNPCLIYSRSYTSPDNTKGLEFWQICNFEVDIFASQYKEAATIADLVKAALNRSKGVFTGFNIDETLFDGEDYRGYIPDHNSHHVSQGYVITIKNT
jgi:predicted secreted acid phosphatase